MSVKHPNSDRLNLCYYWPHKKKSGVSVPLPVRLIRSWENLHNKQTELIPTPSDILRLPRECARGREVPCTLTGSNIPPRGTYICIVLDCASWVSQVQWNQKQALANAFLLCHPRRIPIIETAKDSAKKQKNYETELNFGKKFWERVLFGLMAC